MNRQLKRIISGLLVLCMMSIILPATAMVSLAAGAARISFSDPAVTVGEEVSVTMKFASTDGTILGDTKTTLSYDATMLEYIGSDTLVDGGAGTLIVRSAPIGVTEITASLKFKALQAGDTEVKVIDWNAFDNDGTFLSEVKEGSSTVKVNPMATSSTDATLKNLQIDPGRLDPAFTPAVESYQVNVGLDTEKLTVSGVTNNTGAKLEISGNEGLQEGENTVICKVIAEDGVTVKEYKIIVNKFAGGETEAAETQEGTEAPTEEALTTIKVAAKSYEILALGDDVEIPAGFRTNPFNIGDVTVQGLLWETDEEQRYYVFYARNEEGEKGWYRFDVEQKTIQRYFADPALPSQTTDEKYSELDQLYKNVLKELKNRNYIIFALIAVAVILLILLIVTIRKKGKQTVAESRMKEKEPEEELKTYIPVSRGSVKTLTKEERYMLGEEEEFEEYDDLDMEEISAVQAAVTLDGVEEELASKLAEDTEEAKKSASDDDFEIFDL